MKEEFEEMAKVEICTGDYEIVEMVYNCHPCDFTKKEIVDLFRMGGLFLIKELYPRSKEISDLEEQAKAIQDRINSLSK